jgi:hypothetical protein
MPYSIDWYIENEVIYIYYSGETTIDELRDTLSTTTKMIDDSSHPLVHVITDVSGLTKPLSIKDNIAVVREAGSHSRLGWSLIVGEKSSLIKMGIAFGTSVFKIRNRTFDTMEEAESFLATMDTTINWDKVNTAVLKS